MAKRAPRAAPLEYSPELCQAICELIATSDKGLYRLRSEHPDVMPDPSTLMSWCAAHPEFNQLYARARELQADFIVDAGQEIIDDCKPTGQGGIASARVAKAREQAQHRRWVAARLAPKRWGDRVEHDLGEKAAGTLTELMRRASGTSGGGKTDR